MQQFLKKHWWVLLVLSPIIIPFFVYTLWFVAIFAIAWWEIVIMLCKTFGEWVLYMLQWFVNVFTNP